MQPNTEAIIRLAWSRSLGLDDGALSAPTGDRLQVVREGTLTHLRLWQREVLIGPAWFLDRAADIGDVDGPSLLGLAGDHDGRLPVQVELAYGDAYAAHAESGEASVTDDPAAVGDLERNCPPDDVTEVGLSDLPTTLALVDELDQCLSGAGYREVQGLLAHLRVLTGPAFRRRGHGLLAASLALNDALDAGLIPQWRSRVGHEASAALAARLGLTPVGTHTTLQLSS